MKLSLAWGVRRPEQEEGMIPLAREQSSGSSEMQPLGTLIVSVMALAKLQLHCQALGVPSSPALPPPSAGQGNGVPGRRDFTCPATDVTPDPRAPRTHRSAGQGWPGIGGPPRWNPRDQTALAAVRARGVPNRAQSGGTGPPGGNISLCQGTQGSCVELAR
ncbi:hypothetical protein KIL84_015201 [Mauremys mutica]|uniref:Uncharacterized protein n=1 Tax=Mauremys mutica TaxID=74926 RepID=A0A9D3WM66_9SAUR|nr:hypothetical protein KIL84_015201 [Mauremys mutica]